MQTNNNLLKLSYLKWLNIKKYSIKSSTKGPKKVDLYPPYPEKTRMSGHLHMLNFGH